MYTAILQGETYTIEAGEQNMLNGQPVQFELARSADGAWIMDMNGRRVVADLVRFDRDNRQVVLRVGPNKFSVQVREPIDLLLEKLGMKDAGKRRMNQLKAPMPGLVTRILVKEGDEVKQGAPLLVLEAMKMENIFKAAGDGVVKAIRVSEKQAVEKGAELINFA